MVIWSIGVSLSHWINKVKFRLMCEGGEWIDENYWLNNSFINC